MYAISFNVRDPLPLIELLRGIKIMETRTRCAGYYRKLQGQRIAIVSTGKPGTAQNCRVVAWATVTTVVDLSSPGTWAAWESAHRIGEGSPWRENKTGLLLENVVPCANGPRVKVLPSAYYEVKILEEKTA